MLKYPNVSQKANAYRQKAKISRIRRRWSTDANQKSKIKMQNYNPKIKNSYNRLIGAKKVENCMRRENMI